MESLNDFYVDNAADFVIFYLYVYLVDRLSDGLELLYPNNTKYPFLSRMSLQLKVF